MGIFGRKEEQQPSGKKKEAQQPRLFEVSADQIVPKVQKRRGRPPKDLSSSGPIASEMPVFGPGGGEVMSVQDSGGQFVTVYQEDAEDPNKLKPVIMHRKDARNLFSRKNQPG